MRGDLVTVSKGDVWAMIVFGGLTGVFAVIGVVVSVSRAIRGGPLPVPVAPPSGEESFGEFAGLLGEGAEADGVIGGVDVLVGNMPAWAYGVDVAEHAVLCAVLAVIAACLVLLTRRLGRGQAFHPGNTWLIGGIAIAVLVGWAMNLLSQTALFGAALESGALDHPAVTDRTLAFEMDLPLWPLLVVVGLVPLIAAFHAGERLQRDTEGLV
ncbi:hypothetical protein GCM10027059_00790 [Myceligenerans halotolerans]